MAPAADTLSRVREELDRPLSAVRRAAEEMHSAAPGTRPRIVLVMDEVAELTVRDIGDDRAARAAQQAATGRLCEIARLGRSVDIHLVCCTQRPDAEEATSRATDMASAPKSRTVWLSQQALEDWEVARIGQYETSQFSLREPVDLIVLLRLKVRHDPSPRSTHPHGDGHPVRVGELKDRSRLNLPNLGAKLFTQLTSQRCERPFTGLDMATREVPYIRVPPPHG